MTLKHLRSSTVNKRPQASGMADGQLAINTASGSPGLFFKDAAGNVVKIGPVHVGSGAPNVSPASGGTSGNSIGEQWLDNSGGTYVFKVWDGSTWRSESGEFVNVTGDTMTGSLTMGPAATLIFEGSVDDGFETALTVANPTADQTITLPNISGTVITTGDTGTVTSTMLLDGTIVNADVNASAAIAGTKIAPDFGSQTVQTTGIVSHALGSALAPTVTFTSDTNTGIYSPGADQVAISTNGTQRINIEADGDINIDSGGVFYDATNNRLGIGTTSPGDALEVTGNIRVSANAGSFRNIGAASASNTTVVLQAGSASGTGANIELNRDESILYDGSVHIFRVTDGTAERARIDSSGRLLVGTSTARSFNNALTTPRLQLEGLDVSQASFGLARNSANTGGPGIQFGKSRGTVAGSMTAVIVQDDLGRIQFQGADGTQLQQAAEISAHVDGTPGANDMPGRLVLSTTSDGASSPTERMRISSAGTTTLTSAASTAPFIANIGASEVARIDSSGRLLVGTSSAYEVTSGFSGTRQQIVANDAASFLRYSADNSPETLWLCKSRNATAGLHTVLQNGDGIARFSFQGSDGTNFVSAARIDAEVDGTPGTNDMPGRIVLSTTADGASSPTERLRITSSGRVGVGTMAPARQLSVTTATNDDGIVLTNSSANGGRLRLESTGTGGRVYHIVSTADGSGAGGGKFVVFDNTASDAARLVIDSSGRVGVGTSAPLYTFDCRGQGAFELYNTSGGGNVLNFRPSLGDAGKYNMSISSYDHSGSGVGNADGLSINGFDGVSICTGSNTRQERLRVTEAGLVGIGTTSPLGFLHIETPATTAGWQLRFDSVGLANESGFFRTAADNYEMVLRNGLGGLSYITNTGGASTATLEFNVQGSERARIDSSGRLLVGLALARSNFYNATNSAQFQVEGTGEASIVRNANDVFASSLVLGKSRSSSNTIVQADDVLGILSFQGNDGTEFVQAASISVNVDGTPGANDMPGRLVFSTTADGASSLIERFRITNDGVIAHDQPAPAAVNATATLTVANLKAGIITSTSAAATDMTLPTGTDTQAGFSSTYDNFTFEWSVINTGPSLVRVLAGTAHTVVGSGSVATGTSGRFASRRTATNTFVTYRLS